ncbi:MAG: response regulator transcription factor [bacterium]
MTAPAPVTGERILVVDDEADIVALVAYHLAKSGYRVSTASSGHEALDAARRERPALIVLDLMLPGISGYEVLEQIRAGDTTRDIAVLMLTARREEPDRIQGLSLGADDYLTKPFSPQELVLRVGAILRRVGASGSTSSEKITIGPLAIDLAAHLVHVDGEPIELTPTEFKLLLTLAERRGRVQARAHLLQTVWEAAPDIQTRTVDMHVQRLRAKLGVAGDLIETVRGFGYRIRAPQTRLS